MGRGSCPISLTPLSSSMIRTPSGTEVNLLGYEQNRGTWVFEYPSAGNT